MVTVGQGGFGKAKLTTYKGKVAVVKYVNTAGEPQATLATCTINRQSAKMEGEIQKLFTTSYVAEIYGIEGHAIYMKYYPDGSLRSQIDKGGADKRRYQCALDIIRGVGKIHKLNFIHSDLKASNILVTKKNFGLLYCYISDFGAARIKGSKPIAYTPGFIPVNFFQQPLCFENDIFALGKLFLELFGKFKQEEIRKINYDNFHKNVPYKIFSDNYGEMSDKNKCILLTYYVRECINEDSTKRPSLATLEKIFMT